jgi:beta-1,4-mannosyl-glycoprotein beta-1,4-N-acetylglucosaminyltransferase
MPKLVDCFTFYNELDMLEFRLKELNHVVDYFVLVEATKTFRGAAKPLFYDDNKERYAEYAAKIVHVIVDDMPTAPQNGQDLNWTRENFQRECIRRGIARLDLSPTDLMTVCDCDEIPDPDTLSRLRGTGLTSPVSLRQTMYYYHPTRKLSEDWTHPKVLNIGRLASLKSFNNGEFRGGAFPVIERGGWHFSYFGNAEFIQNKLKQFSHSEYDDAYHTDINHIKAALRGECSLFNNQNTLGVHVPLDTNPYLPKNIGFLLQAFNH